MSAGNFDAIPPPPTPSSPQPATRSFRLPAEYYSAPLSEVRPVFPKWAPYGCGIASAIFLALLFAGGSVLSGPKFGEMLDIVLGMSLGEFRGMYAADVRPESKSEFEAEVKAMRDGLRTGKVSPTNVQPFLKSMQDAIADKKVTQAELEKLTKAASKAQTEKPRAKSP